MPSTTTNYGWQKPTVGGDADAWGGEINATFDAQDTKVKSIDDRVTTLEGNPSSVPVVLAHGSVTNAATFLNLSLASYTAYKRLEIKLNKVNPGLASTGSALQFSTDGGTTWIASAYQWTLANLGLLTVSSYLTVPDATQIQIQNVQGFIHGTLEMSIATGTIVKSGIVGATSMFTGTGFNAATGVNAIKLYTIGGTVTAGTYELVGYL